MLVFLHLANKKGTVLIRFLFISEVGASVEYVPSYGSPHKAGDRCSEEETVSYGSTSGHGVLSSLIAGSIGASGQYYGKTSASYG